MQGTVGAGINQLNFAIGLAQSQVTNYAADESRIRDADIASEAANLSKAQTLVQSSMAALAQANSIPQSVLKSCSNSAFTSAGRGSVEKHVPRFCVIKSRLPALPACHEFVTDIFFSNFAFCADKLLEGKRHGFPRGSRSRFAEWQKEKN